MTQAIHKLQAVLDAQIGKDHVHNIVAAVQSHDRTVDFIGAAGMADPQAGRAMTPDTPYFIASVTKMFTAAIVMQLHQEKQIDLAAPISAYLPDSLTRGIHVYHGTDYRERIKVAELVNQTSGLADYESDKVRGGRSVIDELKAGHDRAIGTPEAIEIVRGLAPHYAPGTPGKANYSNTNYRLLGAIIETITGKLMAVNFAERICARLELQQTYLFDWTAPRTDTMPATIYLKDTPTHIPQYLSSNLSDGGLVSTALECVIFLRAFFEGQLFDKALLEQMMTWNKIFFPLRYGYGLMNFRLPWFFGQLQFIGHSGSTGSFAFVCPARSIYLAGTINQIAAPSKPFFLMSKLVRAVN